MASMKRAVDVKKLAVVIAAAVHRPSPDMSGDIWKALGEGMRIKYERVAEDVAFYLNSDD